LEPREDRLRQAAPLLQPGASNGRALEEHLANLHRSFRFSQRRPIQLAATGAPAAQVALILVLQSQEMVPA